MGRLGVVLFVVLCLGIAGGVYWVAVHQPTETMQHVETVEGTVQSAEVVLENDNEGRYHVPVVTYEYTVDGETYTNDEYALVGTAPAGSRNTAEDIVSEYSAGESVTVYVDSRDPSNSFLTRGSVGLSIWGVIAGLILMGGLGVFALVADALGVEAVDIK